MGFLESIQKRGVQETLKRLEENVVWDVMDAMPADKAPMTVREAIPDGENLPLIDRLFNRSEIRNGQAELWASIEPLAPGTYGMRMSVGSNAEGTAHPHFFVIDRDEESARLLFVDPEHYLNRTKRDMKNLVREGDIRPKVCNLMAIRIREGNAPPDIAVTRFRTNEIKNPSDISFETQLGVARELFQNQGIPPMLADKEREIIFRLVIEPSSDKPMLIQSRYVKSEDELKSFLREGSGTPFLEGKRRSFAGLMEEFSAHLKRDEFKAKPAIAIGAEASQA